MLIWHSWIRPNASNSCAPPFIFAAVTSTAAEAQDHKVMIWGAGTISCGEFIKVVAKNPQNEVVFGQWLNGYISGRNFADRSVADYAAGLDRTALISWITNYCKDNPLDVFFNAAEALITELRSKGRIERR